jgi:hypothetical protein
MLTLLWPTRGATHKSDPPVNKRSICETYIRCSDGADGPGSIPGSLRFVSTRQRRNRPCVSSNLLSNECRGFFPLRAKRPEREADHLPPSSAEVKKRWSYSSYPPIRLHGVVLNQLTSVTIKNIVFWEVKPCNPIGFYRRFGVTYCLRLEGRRVRQSKPNPWWLLA